MRSALDEERTYNRCMIITIIPLASIYIYRVDSFVRTEIDRPEN